MNFANGRNVNFRAVRFEDVAREPRPLVEKILQYLDVPLTSNLDVYLAKHTLRKVVSVTN